MFGLLSAFVGIAGLGVQAYSAFREKEAREEVTEASKRAERLRAEQMRNESIRKQRELIRQQQNASAIALSRSVAQGAGQGNEASSSLFGAFGQIQGAYSRASNTEYQNLQIGEGLFQANLDIADARGEAETYAGLGRLAGSFVANSETIGKIGNSLFPTARPLSMSTGKMGQGTNGIDVLPGAPY